MLPYILTALAGIAVGVAAMRVWSSREPADTAETPETVKAAVLPDGSPARTVVTTRNLMIGTGVLLVVGVGAYFLQPAEEEAGMPQAQAIAAPSGDSLADVDTMIARLEERLAANPSDGEGFRMLGWSYSMTGRPQKAIEAYKRALALLPDSPAVHAGYGEALTGVAGGMVTADAKQEFEKAIRIDPAEPRSAYFLALWDAQNGREKQAVEKWIELANGAASDAPWQADLYSQIDKVSKKLGIDVSARLKKRPDAASPAADAPVITPADVEAANALPKGQQQAMIDGMVEGLAAKLARDPSNADGWARLLRSRMVLGQTEQASKDLRTARKALSSDKAGLAAVNAAAAAAAVPGA